MRGLRAVFLAAALAAPHLGAPQGGEGGGAGARVPAVPQAAAARLAPKKPSAQREAPEARRVEGEAPPAKGTKRPSKPAPARAWRARARPATEVAPGVLARAAAKSQQARGPARQPDGCELPPAKRAPGTRCPLAPGQIESLEMDWNAPVSR